MALPAGLGPAASGLEDRRSHPLNYGSNWWRERDSNPRPGFPSTALAGQRLEPLDHLSVSYFDETSGLSRPPSLLCLPLRLHPCICPHASLLQDLDEGKCRSNYWAEVRTTQARLETASLGSLGVVADVASALVGNASVLPEHSVDEDCPDRCESNPLDLSIQLFLLSHQTPHKEWRSARDSNPCSLSHNRRSKPAPGPPRPCAPSSPTSSSGRRWRCGSE